MYNISELVQNKNLNNDFVKAVMDRVEPKFMPWQPLGVVEAAKIISKNKNNTFCVYFDPDPDGLFSGLLVCKFLDNLGLKYVHTINQGRFHGFDFNKLEWLKAQGVSCIIAVDFVMMADEIKAVAEDFDVIVMDHHEVGDIQMGDNYVTINNQYVEEPTDIKYLSGAGVVFYSLLAIAKITEMDWLVDECFSDESKIYVGISLLSDLREIENMGAYYFLYTMYNYHGESFITNFFKDSYNFGEDIIDRSFVDYKLAPCINAMFRFGEADTVVKIFMQENVVGVDYLLEMGKLQSRIIYDLSQEVEGKLIEFDNLVVAPLVDDPKYEKKYGKIVYLPNFTGLVASRLVQKYKKPAFVITQMENGRFKGSVRSRYKLDYLGLFRRFMDANGHQNAFGAYFDEPVDLSVINKELRELEKNQRLLEDTQQDLSVLYTENLFFLCKKYHIEDLGHINNYLRSEKMFRIAFKSRNIQVIRDTGKYLLVTIDGIEVSGFFIENLDRVKTIVPNNVKGYLQLYLE